MKIKSLLIGMLACTALVGCSNEDDLVNNDQPVLKGDKAYMVINIMSGDDLSSRGSEPTDKPLQLGTADEHKITTADFYFYDASGNYVTKASAWNGGTATEAEGSDVAETTKNHIEFKSNTIIVLQNLPGKTQPKYVVAVLNAPSGFTLGNTLAQAQSKLIGYKEGFAGTADLGAMGGIITSVSTTSGETTTTNNYFIMSNSTYNNSDETSKFFATALEDNNFSEEPIELDAQGNYTGDCEPVQIYVERLAAKVQLDVNINGVTKGQDGSYTVDLGSDFNIDGTGNQTLKAKVTGWGLNATNRNSYIMKNVPAFATSLNFIWDAKDYHRSYWGESHNYGKGNYPTTFATGTTTGGNELSKSTYTLDYISWNNLLKAAGEVDYCAENTNSATFLNSVNNFHSTVTEIILKAEVVNEEGSTVDLFRYDNMLYTQDGYFNRLFIKVNPQIYKKDGDKYEQITVTDVTLTSDALIDEGDGRVSAAFTLKDGTYYNFNGSKYTEAENAQDLLNTAFTTHFNAEKTAGNLAKHYNAGKMYYNIPIEHLREGDGTPYGENSAINVLDAEYGVVRNHYYKVTVSSISQLGSAVHDPAEEIVPNPGENITYYVGAQINILSWKIVNKTVGL